jgi:hypothetical protein
MKVTLRRKSWMFREWEVSIPTGNFRIAYSGHGHAFEGGGLDSVGRGYRFQSVWVDGLIVVKTRRVFWYVPRFDFNLGGLGATIDVRVWPWLTLRAIRLSVGNEVCYTEGFQ